MAQGDKCGNCERSLYTAGVTKGICVLPTLPNFIPATQRSGEVDPENTTVCEYYSRMHPNHGKGNG